MDCSKKREDRNLLESKIDEIIAFAKKNYVSTDDLHGLGHVERVIHLAKKIHDQEGGSWHKIQCIGWLHDVGRKFEKVENEHHATISAKMSRNLLIKLNIAESVVEEIVQGILSHSFSIGGTAQTLEAKIISDADKLDALGAVGIYRVCAYQGQRLQGIRAVIDHCDDKLFKLIDKMYLPYSKQMAKERTYRIRQFQSELIEELNH
ncbi:HD domain-containing protein [Candidatus Lokiarchaeum ossiferum]|uniref:HD domain-containing protein n=1 Tax=Candidatus Lokiarchaeum ossiferum TaxID=2951803 RepID=UPI00352DEB8A